MSKKTKIIVGSVVAVVVIGALTAAIRNKDKDVPRVTTAKVEKIDLVSKVTANGKVQAQRKVDMSALVMGLASDKSVKVDDTAFIATSFPDFIPMMRSLGAEFS